MNIRIGTITKRITRNNPFGPIREKTVEEEIYIEGEADEILVVLDGLYESRMETVHGSIPLFGREEDK